VTNRGDGLLAKDRKTAARREQIVKAAEKIFAEKGFHEATISEIAKGAGLSEPTIYEYFPSKEDILFNIPADTSEKLGELLRFHLQMAKGTAGKLRAMIYILFWIHQTDPNYAAVSYIILKQNRSFIKTEAYSVLRKNLRPLIDVIEEGIASGEIKSGFTPYFIRSVILGTIEHLTTRKIMIGTEDNLLDYVDPLVDLVMGGIRPDNSGSKVRFKVTIEPESSSRSVAPGIEKQAGSERKKPLPKKK
jgi:TetR/AcrR family transcriptional regulator, fatty acid metabolism regulator protein